MGYGPITLEHSSGQVMVQERIPEAATQTFKLGVPLKLSSGMAVIGDSGASDWSGADVIVGISAEAGHNLTTANTAEPATSEGTPPNQSSAKKFAQGAWSKDGKVSIYKADGINVFRCSLKTGQVYAQTLIIASTYYTLKYDSATGFYYIDNTDTSGNNAVCELVGGCSDDTTKVLFRFIAAQRYYA